jgi:hypothetical protein
MDADGPLRSETSQSIRIILFSEESFALCPTPLLMSLPSSQSLFKILQTFAPSNKRPEILQVTFTSLSTSRCPRNNEAGLRQLFDQLVGEGNREISKRRKEIIHTSKYSANK